MGAERQGAGEACGGVSCACSCSVCLLPYCRPGWLRQALRVAGLSHACQTAVTHHCGLLQLMRSSDRKCESC